MDDPADSKRPPHTPPDHDFEEEVTPEELEERTVVVNAVNLLRMPLRITPVDTLALVDTGAVASLLSFGLFQKINQTEVEEVTPYYRQFKSAGGHPLQVQGCYRIPFEIVGYSMKHTFYVIHGLQEDCIVGLDFLTVHDLTFSGKKRMLTMGGTRRRIFLSSARPQPLHAGMTFQVEASQEETKPSNPIIMNLEERLEAFLNRHEDLFATNPANLGRCKLVQHHIETTGSPVFQNRYRTAVQLRPVVKQQIEEMLKNDIIRPSSSPYGSPILLVKKKDSDYRFCVDYRKLNENTVKDRYPLPRIDETIDSLHGAMYFSTLDLASGYWQIELDEESKPKTAFTTEFGHFEFNRMPFGLQGAPSSFQRLMNHIFREELNMFVLVYLDDIIVFSRNLDDHFRHLETVFQRLREAGLKLKLKKCSFVKDSVHYLGHIVSASGLATDPAKVAAMANFPAPRNVKQLQTFLGLTNYYRRFVPNFAHLAHPLTELTKKDVEFIWDERQENSFKSLKDRLVSSPVLAFPDFTKPFVVCTDACDHGVGAVLAQKQEVPGLGETEVVIAYMSRHLLERERHWATVEKEAFAIIQACKTFFPYLYGRTFTVVTDHKPLQWLASIKEPTGRLMRWSLWLQQFDMTIGYRTGKTNQNADCLSRTPINVVDTVSATGSTTLFDREGPATLQWIPEWKAAQEADEFCQLVLNGLRTENPQEHETLGKRTRSLSGPEDKFLLLPGELLGTRKGQLVVPQAMTEELLKRNHDHKLTGHMGVARTLSRMATKYFWPKMKEAVAKYVRNCLPCAKRKGHRKNVAPLQPLPATTFAWQRLAMDIVGPLEESYKGNRYILVMTEYSTRYAETAPMTNQTAVSVAHAFVQSIILRHGAPLEVLTDQGTQFQSDLVQSILDILQIKRLRTSAYRPETDGLTERFNRTLCDMLASYVARDPPRWDDYLPYVTFAYNTSQQASLNETPFYLLYGHDPLGPDDLTARERLRFPLEEDDSFEENWRQAREIALQHLQDAQVTQKTYYDKKVREEEIKIGDWVLLREMRAAPKKFEPRWLGPFKVTKQLGRANFAIQRSAPLSEDGTEPPSEPSSQTEEVVHKNRIKRYGGQTRRPRSPTQEDESAIESSSRDAQGPEQDQSTPPDEQTVVPPETETSPISPETPIPRYALRRVIRPPDRLDL